MNLSGATLLELVTVVTIGHAGRFLVSDAKSREQCDVMLTAYIPSLKCTVKISA